jgi:hypothetical protein
MFSHGRSHDLKGLTLLRDTNRDIHTLQLGAGRLEPKPKPQKSV